MLIFAERKFERGGKQGCIARAGYAQAPSFVVQNHSNKMVLFARGPKRIFRVSSRHVISHDSPQNPLVVMSFCMIFAGAKMSRKLEGRVGIDAAIWYMPLVAIVVRRDG